MDKDIKYNKLMAVDLKKLIENESKQYDDELKLLMD